MARRTTEGYPEKGEKGKVTEHRSFDLLTKLAILEGKLDNLLDSSRESKNVLDTSVASINSINIPAMSAKNTLKFHGRVDESAEELVDSIENLRDANGWNAAKTLGNLIWTLQGEARLWYRSQPEGFFSPPRANDADPWLAPTYDSFKAKFLDKYKDDKSPGDYVCEVLECKQKVGQSVDDYISLIHPKLCKVKDTNEETRVSLAVQGFLPVLRDQLKLKDVKTFKELELWARRLSRLSFVKRGDQSINVVDDDMNDMSESDIQDVAAYGYAMGARQPYTNQYNRGGRGGFGYQYSSPQASQSNKGQMSVKSDYSASGEGQQGPSRTVVCWTCGGNHYKSGCPDRKRPGRSGKRSYRGRGTGRGSGNGNHGNDTNSGPGTKN